MPDIQFTGVTPTFRVADIDGSFAYYVYVLGFSVDWRDGRFGCVNRGKVSIMLAEREQGQPGSWWRSVE